MKAKSTPPLDDQDHQLLALWAADCAEHVLAFFEDMHPDDDRPRQAIAAGRSWARGQLSVGQARQSAFAAHAAARETCHETARAAARAAGHAAATAHVADHARHAAAYAVKATTTAAIPSQAGTATAAERDWQRQRLPEHFDPAAYIR